MALLTAQQRSDIARDINAQASQERLEFGALVKADIVAAVAAIDSFFDTNAAAFNTAIPLPARTGLTVRQKAILLILVLRARYGA